MRIMKLGKSTFVVPCVKKYILISIINVIILFCEVTKFNLQRYVTTTFNVKNIEIRRRYRNDF